MCEINLHILKLREKNAANKVINKIAEDFEKIVAVTKLKELKRYGKNILPKNEKHAIKNKINKNRKTTWSNVLLWVQRLYTKF